MPSSPNMYYVYILYSEKDKKLYIGSTPDLKARYHKHSTGYVRSTKHRRPLKLIYYEAYLLNTDASRREKFYARRHVQRGNRRVERADIV